MKNVGPDSNRDHVPISLLHFRPFFLIHLDARFCRWHWQSSGRAQLASFSILHSLLTSQPHLSAADQNWMNKEKESALHPPPDGTHFQPSLCPKAWPTGSKILKKSMEGGRRALGSKEYPDSQIHCTKVDSLIVHRTIICHELWYRYYWLYQSDDFCCPRIAIDIWGIFSYLFI
jgi:hypothetical protein